MDLNNLIKLLEAEQDLKSLSAFFAFNEGDELRAAKQSGFAKGLAFAIAKIKDLDLK